MTEFTFDTSAPEPVSGAALATAFTDRRGTMTAWAMMWTMVLIVIGGVAVDTNNAYGFRTRLQAVADASALAAAAQMEPTDLEVLEAADADAARATARADARAAALTLARMNMPRAQHGDVIRPEDVVFGKRDAAGNFVKLNDMSEEVTTVRVMAGRDGVRGNVIPTWMLRLSPLAPTEWALNAAAFASVMDPTGDDDDDDGTDPGDCPSANIISTGDLQTAANNTYEPGVCLHGHEGVKTAGNDYMPEGVHVTAPEIELIDFHDNLKPGSAAPEDILGEMETETPILDALEGGLFAAYWNALLTVGTTKMYAEPLEGAEAELQNYFGPQLPPSVYMPAPSPYGRVNYRNNLNVPAAALRNFKFRDGNIVEYDVWQWVGDMNFTGNVSLSKTVLVVDGDVNFSGGSDVVMKDVFVIASGEIKNAGNAQLGYRLDEFCEIGEYTVTLLAGDQVKLGGSGNSGQAQNEALEAGEDVEGAIKGTFGVLIAAGGGFNPGGALHQSGGLYVEADEAKTQLPGNMHLRTCDTQLRSFLEDFPLDDAAPEVEEIVQALAGTVILEDPVETPQNADEEAGAE